MTLGYVEDLAAKYFMKKGYLVNQNVWFQLSKETTRKKVAGWSDIDIFALEQEEVLIIQCKSFLGTGKSKKIGKELVDWFNNALQFLQKDKIYKKWLTGRKIKKILVVDCSIKATENYLNKKGIEVLRYTKMLRDLIKMLQQSNLQQKKRGGIGKEADLTLRMLSAMINEGLIDEERLKD